MFINICKDISSTHSAFNFIYIAIHILGSIYERFLGKVVIATAKRVHIDEKPEVRKAGGVYYTPKYIVDYIIQNTVGKQIKNKTPKQIAELKFIDIACGSGSFLIGAYDCLLDYHKKFYTTKLESKIEIDKRNEDYGNVDYNDGQWVLSLKLKQSILINNIFGVDIDAQAVEVSQLSLFLKMLEDESLNSTQIRQGSVFSKVLPDLTKNIVCGNSLIDFDVTQMNGRLFEDEELGKINPMDYKTIFPSIMENGGFDSIVGNPPYIPIESFSINERKYYQLHFSEFTRKYDSSVIFISKALSLLNKKGFLAYISTQTWETGENYIQFRQKIFSNNGLIQIINLPYNIFKDAYVDTGIFIFSKIKVQNYKFYSYNKKDKLTIIDELPFKTISTNEICEPDYKIIFDKSVNDLIKTFRSEEYQPLGDISISTQGLSESVYKKTDKINGFVIPYYNANAKRYYIELTNSYNVDLETKKSLIQFYEQKEKILVRRIINRQDRLDVCYFDQAGVFKKDLNPFIITDNTYSTKYVIGLMNSKLFSWIYLNSSSIATRDDFRQTTLSELRKLPIRKINKLNQSQHDEIEAHVNQLNLVKRKLIHAKTEKEKNFIEHQCNSLERQIDNVVYELYQLSSSQKNLIEQTYN